MILGDHRIFTIPDLFSFVDMRRLSGMLIIASPTRYRSFSFQDGQLVYVLCNDPDQLLGRILVRDLGISETTVARALQDLEREGYLGDELVRRELITQEQLDTIVREQMTLALREVVRWDPWAFQFLETQRDSPLPTLRLSAQAFIFELSRQLDEINEARALFEDLRGVPAKELVWVSSSRPPGWHESLPHPAELLDEIDGHTSIGAMLREFPYPVLPLAQALRLLIDRDHLVVWEPQGSSIECVTTEVFPKLPVAQETVHKIWNFQADDSDPNALRELVSSDPILLARTLRIGALQQHWGDFRPLVLEDVLDRMGTDSLRSLLTAEALRAQFLGNGILRSDNHIWEDSYRVSQIAGQLADIADYADPDLVRAAGLLHDIGRLALVATDPDLYAATEQTAVEEEISLVEAEQLYFETDHCEVGTRIARNWGFSPKLRQAIGRHHSDYEAPVDPLLAFLILALQIHHEEELDPELLLEIDMDPEDADTLPQTILQAIDSESIELQSV